MVNTSCIILNYNDASTTYHLVEEIKNFETIKQIIVVDNLSTDDSFEKLSLLIDEKVFVIQTDRNGGYGYGNNFGIRFAHDNFKSDYVLIANPDVHFQDQTVFKMVDFLDKNDEFGVCAPVALKPNNQPQNLIAWKLQSFWDYALSASMVYLKFFSGKFYQQSYFKDKEWVAVDVVPGSLLLVDTKKMLAFGMYDEDNFLYSEEEMLAIKFRNNDIKTCLLLNETYIHEHSVSISKSIPSELNKKKMNLESRMYVLNKYYHPTQIKMKILRLISKVALFENKVIFKIKGYS